MSSPLIQATPQEQLQEVTRAAIDVQGLTNDSPVFYRGLRVGRVSNIQLTSRIDTQRSTGRERLSEKIEVTVAVDWSIDIRDRSYAVFEKPFIAGAPYIQIAGRLESDHIKPKKRLGDKPYPEIREGASFLQATSTSAQELLTRASTTVDRCVYARDGAIWYASNSLVVLLGRLGASIDLRFDHRDWGESMALGVFNYVRQFHVLHPRIPTMSQLIFESLRIGTDGTPSFHFRDVPRSFKDFADYVEQFSSVMKTLHSNATDPARKRPMHSVTSASRGYDSAAVTALVTKLIPGIDSWTAKRSNTRIPRLLQGVMNADVAAMRMSQASAIDSPAPAAAPGSAASVGLRRPNSAPVKRRCRSCRSATRCATVQSRLAGLLASLSPMYPAMYPISLQSGDKTLLSPEELDSWEGVEWPDPRC